MSLANKIQQLRNREEEDLTQNGRYATSMDVIMYCYGYKLLKAKVKNIGIDGLLLSSDLSQLPTNSYLEVSFRLRNQRGSEIFRIPVFRDQICENGTQLLFVFPSEHTEKLANSLSIHFQENDSIRAVG